MSFIRDLIRDLCPDGVEFLPLGDVCKIFSGFAFDSSAFNTNRVGLPLIRIRDVNTGYSETFYSGEYDDRFLVADGDILVGMDGDFRATRWQHGKALLNQRVCRLERFSPVIIKDYVYYQVQGILDRIHQSIQGSTVKHLSSRDFAKAKIPVPPLPVQQEIVRILDEFSQLEAELEAELETRRQQYGYYRDELLAFDGRNDVRRVPIGQLGTIFRGKRFTKKDYVDEGGVGVIHYGEIYTVFGTSANEARSRVREELRASLRYAVKGDVVLTDVGETVEDVGKAVAWLGDEDVAIHDHCYVIRSDVDAVFFSYVMQTVGFVRAKEKYIARTKVKTLLLEGLKRIQIPLPPIEEQRRIAEQLRLFDDLVNDLNIGLPAELAARRKQYEYYRDKLLTFKELER